MVDFMRKIFLEYYYYIAYLHDAGVQGGCTKIVAAFVVTKCMKTFGGQRRRRESNEGNHACAVHV